jgi:formate dehydrogenase iron-sulfur subunit
MAEPMGFFTDVSVCIGCKACEVACKQWNQLPANNGGVVELTGNSYDNTGTLDGTTWRHVRFVEDFDDRAQGRWLMFSDVCKHCVQAGCLEVCPTGAIFRTEFDTVVIQSDICNGCRACIPACPFDVIDINPVNNTAMKCTLCYDRMQAGMIPACAQACPTESIKFGPVSELKEEADVRLMELQREGVEDASLYGRDEEMLGGLNAFFLIVGPPEWYGLPRNPQLPTSRSLGGEGILGAISAAVAIVLGAVSFRKLGPQRRRDEADREGSLDDQPQRDGVAS